MKRIIFTLALVSLVALTASTADAGSKNRSRNGSGRSISFKSSNAIGQVKSSLPKISINKQNFQKQIQKVQLPSQIQKQTAVQFGKPVINKIQHHQQHHKVVHKVQKHLHIQHQHMHRARTCRLQCHYRGWARHCWLPTYGCQCHYCPVRHCWFYYYAPYNCYLPIDLLPYYTPVATEQPVALPGSFGQPALPPGAVPLPGQ